MKEVSAALLNWIVENAITGLDKVTLTFRRDEDADAAAIAVAKTTTPSPRRYRIFKSNGIEFAAERKTHPQAPLEDVHTDRDRRNQTAVGVFVPQPRSGLV